MTLEMVGLRRVELVWWRDHMRGDAWLAVEYVDRCV
jgi:hypothetical protein